MLASSGATHIRGAGCGLGGCDNRLHAGRKPRLAAGVARVGVAVGAPNRPYPARSRGGQPCHPAQFCGTVRRRHRSGRIRAPRAVHRCRCRARGRTIRTRRPSTASGRGGACCVTSAGIVVGRDDNSAHQRRQDWRHKPRGRQSRPAGKASAAVASVASVPSAMISVSRGPSRRATRDRPKRGTVAPISPARRVRVRDSDQRTVRPSIERASPAVRRKSRGANNVAPSPGSVATVEGHDRRDKTGTAGIAAEVNAARSRSYVRARVD
jgi:hypothetical protein